jgi:hypothetical protein
MTFEEYANVFLEESGTPCMVLETETMIVRNMEWIISNQSTTYQHPDANYIINPTGITGNAKLMHSFTSPNAYYQVGTQVRYGDYIYFRARNLASANPYAWYIIEYCISTENKIIFEVPDMGWYSYTIGQSAHFCPIAPRTLLLYEPYDGYGTNSDYIRKIFFYGDSAMMTTELEIQTIPGVLSRYINFFDVIKGSDNHIYAIVWCTEYDIPYPDIDPRRHAWYVAYKDFTTNGDWENIVLDSLPTWGDIGVWNGWQPILLGDKVVTINEMEDTDYNDYESIVTFDVIAKTLVKYDWTPGGYRWTKYAGPSLGTTSAYFNIVKSSPYNSWIYKLNALTNTWTEVRDIGGGGSPPYCVILSSRTHAYFWNTITHDFYDAETNTLIGNITFPHVSGAQQTSFLIDDNDLIWYYESGAVKAKDFSDTVAYSKTLTGFTPKTYTNIHLFNNYIILQTYSAFAGKEQDYYLVT